MASLEQLSADWDELSQEYKKLETGNNSYLELLEKLDGLQQRCTKDIQHQRYRLGQINANLRKLVHNMTAYRDDHMCLSSKTNRRCDKIVLRLIR